MAIALTFYTFKNLYVLRSFSFPALASNMMAAIAMLYGLVYHVTQKAIKISGNHMFAVLKGSDYEHLSKGFHTLFKFIL